jgi:hypothetical protein
MGYGFHNFLEVHSREEVKFLAPTPLIIMREDHRHHEWVHHLLDVDDANEHAMAKWRQQHPKDVEAELEFWQQNKTERRAARVDNRRGKALIESEESDVGDDY